MEILNQLISWKLQQKGTVGSGGTHEQRLPCLESPLQSFLFGKSIECLCVVCRQNLHLKSAHAFKKTRQNSKTIEKKYKLFLLKDHSSSETWWPYISGLIAIKVLILCGLWENLVSAHRWEAVTQSLLLLILCCYSSSCYVAGQNNNPQPDILFSVLLGNINLKAFQEMLRECGIAKHAHSLESLFGSCIKQRQFSSLCFFLYLNPSGVNSVLCSSWTTLMFPCKTFHRDFYSLFIPRKCIAIA